MKQALQLRVSTQLAMTPQLQQAIRLLLMSSLEFSQEIQSYLDNNVMLEAEDAADPAVPEPALVRTGHADFPEAGKYNSAGITKSKSSEFNTNDLDGYTSRPESLQDYLTWQAELARFTATEARIAAAIIDGINTDGYLECDLTDIIGCLDEQDLCTEDDVLAVLHRVQRFDPVGVGARNLRECLTVQLLGFAEDTPGLQTALEIVGNHLDVLAANDLERLRIDLGADAKTFDAAVSLVRKLHPRPGNLFGAAETEYVVPDVILTRDGDDWIVQLNSAVRPKIHVNETYAQVLRGSGANGNYSELKEQLKEARWLVRNIETRDDTILRVARAILQRQVAFLESGEQALVPMVLRDIAAELDMHESTISRVTNRKYVQTPRGVFELKHFFSRELKTENGRGCSAAAVRAMVKHIVAEENPVAPLSDSQIVSELKARGVNIARRTVAKYRDILKIPPVALREKNTRLADISNSKSGCASRSVSVPAL
ncbi:MAG: RNA polymerase factor sigma-54 [Gammaproteobacteria bacterium]|nr:RNA polymerase factor sigma-54 [Gammaproteobacteria bacterium]